MNETKRLDSLLSDLGLCARRKAEQFLLTNNVQLNGKKITIPGTRVDIKTGRIEVNGKLITVAQTQQEVVYYLVNKPKGFVSALSDNSRKKTVVDLVPKKNRLFPIGRLDELSSGLVLLTNDGELAHQLSLPGTEIPKTYLVWVVGVPSEKRLDRIRAGIRLKEGLLKPMSATVLKTSPKRTLIELILQEDKCQLIRALFTRVGINVVELKRVAIGSIKLNFLGVGKNRILTESEIESLKILASDKKTESTR